MRWLRGIALAAGVAIAAGAVFLPVPRMGDPVWVADLPFDSAHGKSPPLNRLYGTAADVDLLLVRITPAAEGWNLWIHMRQLPNLLDFASGYSVPQVDILVTETAEEPPRATGWQLPYPGSNVRIAEDVLQQIRVNPAGAWWKPAAGADQVPLNQEAVGSAIRVRLPAEFTPPRRGVVLVGAYNQFAPDGYRDVRASAADDAFGGGDDGHLDPHVLDTLGTPGQLAWRSGTQPVTLAPRRLASPPLWREVLLPLGLVLAAGAAIPRSRRAHGEARGRSRAYVRSPGVAQRGSAGIMNPVRTGPQVAYAARKSSPRTRRHPGLLKTIRDILVNLPDLWRK